ncbi:hypothetical protein N7G274_006974 [Stereocaulon virgatum]|uniref:Pre-mRNA-splicing factor n=1 Tax=Stereocaulon virgatum TaxID=373712 RepID=A0ABR4A577_9LECA
MPSVDPSPTIVGSSKPFSISFGSTKSRSTQPLPPRKRPHSALADLSGSDDEGGGPQLVTAFDHSAGGAITNDRVEEQAPLVIQAEKNRDWREESRRKRRKPILPHEVQAAQSRQAQGQQASRVERDEVSKVFGLEFVKRDAEGDTNMPEAQPFQQEPEHIIQPPKTADDEAMQALVSGQNNPTLRIEAIEAGDRDDYEPGESNYSDNMNEDDRFKADVASRPDVATLDDYAAMPVDSFGAALLRGMGWKDGEPVGKRRAGTTATPEKHRIVERRPALLGIGAKEVPGGVGDEFGAWGKVAKGKRKTDLTYSPVMLKNSITGEMLTEEELEAKKQKEKEAQVDKDRGKGEDDWRQRRDRNLRVDAERKGKRVRLGDERNGDRGRDISRDEGHRTHRSRSRERRWRDKSPPKESRRRERSRESDRSRHIFSQRHSKERERNYRSSSSRHERSQSAERSHRWR